MTNATNEPKTYLRSFGQTRSVDADKGIVEATLSTSKRARDGMIIETNGWLLDAYRTNPVVLWRHNDMEVSSVVARTTEIGVQGDELVGRAEFDMEDPDAARLFGKISRGFINAVSVRWNPVDTEVRLIDGQETLVFTRQELLEWSFTPVPVDTAALVVRADNGQAINIEAFRQLAEPASLAEQAEPTLVRSYATAGRLLDYIVQRHEGPSLDDLIVAMAAAECS